MSPNRIPGSASDGPLDLAERLRLAGAPLRARLRRREALEEIVREAYSDMEEAASARYRNKGISEVERRHGRAV